MTRLFAYTLLLVAVFASIFAYEAVAILAILVSVGLILHHHFSR